jgi:AbrB family looped-hinge helix DNA binding protein
MEARMTTTLVSSKGQVIIPKAVREARHWTPGTRLEVRDTADGVLLTVLTTAGKTPLAAGLKAIRQKIDYRGPTRTLEDMDAAVRREAARRKPGK